MDSQFDKQTPSVWPTISSWIKRLHCLQIGEARRDEGGLFQGTVFFVYIYYGKRSFLDCLKTALGSEGDFSGKSDKGFRP